MRLSVNHPDADLIFAWLSDNYGVRCDESDLCGEKVIDLIARTGFWKLEDWLGEQFETTIDLPKDMRFVDATKMEVLKEPVVKVDEILKIGGFEQTGTENGIPVFELKK